MFSIRFTSRQCKCTVQTYLIRKKEENTSSFINLDYSKRAFSLFGKKQQMSNNYGQPTFESHEHLLSKGEFVQGISLSEIVTRRENLIERILKNSNSKSHVIIVPSANKKYMSKFSGTYIILIIIKYNYYYY